MEEQQCLSRSGQERALKVESLAKEAAAEAEALEADTVRLREEVASKEAESANAGLGVDAMRLRATQVHILHRELTCGFPYCQDHATTFGPQLILADGARQLRKCPINICNPNCVLHHVSLY